MTVHAEPLSQRRRASARKAAAHAAIQLVPPAARRSAMAKKAQLFRAFVTGKPLYVTWQATYNCNYGCTFCNYWQNDFKPHEESSLDDFRIGAAKLAELGSLMISVAGGEPMLRGDLHEIIRILSLSHFPFMVTSGAGMTRARARKLWDAGLWGCSVSIDYADPARHAAHRGVRFAFERAVQAIEELLDARTDPSHQRVQLMSVLTNDNLDQMEDLCRLAHELGVYWQVQPYSVMKTGDASQRHLPGATAALLDLKRRYPRTVHANRSYLEKFDAAADGGIPGCIAGKALFNIDNRMTVSKCVEFSESEPLGNLRTDSMTSITRRLAEAHAANTCRSCWYSCRGEVEVLYEPRGFLNSLPTLIWQSAGQRPTPTAGLHRRYRRGAGGELREGRSPEESRRGGRGTVAGRAGRSARVETGRDAMRGHAGCRNMSGGRR